MTWVVHEGDSLDVLRGFEAESVDALVTDPPSGIGFMGEAWDHDKGGRAEWVAWMGNVMREARRVLKPGAFGLVWALPRTAHWTATALDDAEFEVRDKVTHIFGTGFPKSKNVEGGKGTGLKPAHEDWILVRRPIEGTVMENLSAFGTGVLNIDEARVAYASAADLEERIQKNPGRGDLETSGTYGANRPQQGRANSLGRWPSNVVASHAAECVVTGTRVVHGRGRTPRKSGPSRVFGAEGGGGLDGVEREPREMGRELVDAVVCAPGCPVAALGDEARFFFVPKPSAREREEGLDDLPMMSVARSTGGLAAIERGEDAYGPEHPGWNKIQRKRNTHPTVKSVALMRYLVRLVTPRGGVVLDPFAGSGTTGIACVLEGAGFVGIERDPKFAEIARRRIQHWHDDAAPRRAGTPRLDSFDC